MLYVLSQKECDQLVNKYGKSVAFWIHIAILGVKKHLRWEEDRRKPSSVQRDLARLLTRIEDLPIEIEWHLDRHGIEVRKLREALAAPYEEERWRHRARDWLVYDLSHVNKWPEDESQRHEVIKYIIAHFDLDYDPVAILTESKELSTLRGKSQTALIGSNSNRVKTLLTRVK